MKPNSGPYRATRTILGICLGLAAVACNGDAPTAVAQGPAELRLVDRLGEAVAGAVVLHHDAQGRLQSRGVTDAEGRARVEVRGGDSLTLLREGAGSRMRQAWTFTGVQPGDELMPYGPFDPALLRGAGGKPDDFDGVDARTLVVRMPAEAGVTARILGCFTVGKTDEPLVLDDLFWRPGDGELPLSHEVAIPRGYSGLVQADLTQIFDDGRALMLYQRVAVDPSIGELGFDTRRPVVHGVAVSGGDHPVARWEFQADGVEADVVQLHWVWNAADGQRTRWSMLLPPDARSASPPIVPGDLAGILPSNTPGHELQVSFREDSLTPGFDQARRSFTGGGLFTDVGAEVRSIHASAKLRDREG